MASRPKGTSPTGFPKAPVVKPGGRRPGNGIGGKNKNHPKHPR